MTLDKFSIWNLITSPDFGFFVFNKLPVIIILPLSIFLLYLHRCLITQPNEFKGLVFKSLDSPINSLFQYNFEFSWFKSKFSQFLIGFPKITPADQALSAISVNASRFMYEAFLSSINSRHA